MPDDGALPRGMTPRLLSREAAAAYCGIAPETFDVHVRPHVSPIEMGTRRLWDVKALDHWLDQQSGLIAEFQPIESWLERLGDDRARPRD